MSTVAALVPAAGSGRRLGLGPKAFLRVGGRTLLEHAAALFEGLADELIVAVPSGREDDARALVPGAVVIAGGSERQDTVERLQQATTASWLVVHDAARPFTPASVVARVLAAAREAGAASACVAVADTLHDVRADVPVARDDLRAIQTPQAFAREVLAGAHRAARAADRSATDDAQLVRAAGGRVALVEGSPWSTKVTGPDDLAWLEALARARPATTAS